MPYPYPRTNYSLKISVMQFLSTVIFKGAKPTVQTIPETSPLPTAGQSREQHSPRADLSETRENSGNGSCLKSNPASVPGYWGAPCLPASLSPLMYTFNIHLFPFLMWIKRATCKANKRKITVCCCSLKLQLNRARSELGAWCHLPAEGGGGKGTIMTGPWLCSEWGQGILQRKMHFSTWRFTLWWNPSV